MKIIVHSRTKKIFIIVSLFVIGVLAVFLLLFLISRPSEKNKDVSDDTGSTIIDDIKKPDSNNPTKPDNNPPKDDSICVGNEIIASKLC